MNDTPLSATIVELVGDKASILQDKTSHCSLSFFFQLFALHLFALDYFPQKSQATSKKS